MKTCEHFEEQLSVWLDGELDRPGQVETLDHIVRCEACRHFYGEARALDGLVAAVRTPKRAEAPSPELWKRIEREASRKAEVIPFRRRIPAWAWQAAAVIVLAIGLGVVFWAGSPGPAGHPRDAEVLLGEDAGEMTDDRFVELTKEVLRADRRYHAALHQVMKQVLDDTEVREASVEYASPSPVSGEAAGGEVASRGPV
jgi:predicted anti-sigma-YlaC factor YlaD